MCLLLDGLSAELTDLHYKLWFLLIIFSMQSQISKLLRSSVLNKKPVQSMISFSMLCASGTETIPNCICLYRKHISCRS